MTRSDPIAAIVDQLAACNEQLTRPGNREADYHAALGGRPTELADQANGEYEPGSGNPLFQRSACAAFTPDAAASLRDRIRRERRMTHA